MLYPYFTPSNFWVSLAIFVILKPLCYFAFIRAFRYRVSGPIPMTTVQSVRLAILRAVIGPAFMVGGATVFALPFGHSEETLRVLAVWFFLSRILAWYVVGSMSARLRGTRLWAWTGLGTLLNLLIDGSFYAGYFFGPGGWVGFVSIPLLISALDVRGSRQLLRERFDGCPRCTQCAYNLTGNLSGICPECGTPVGPLVARLRKHWTPQ